MNIEEIRARYTDGNAQFRDVGACTLQDILRLFARIDRLTSELEQKNRELEGCVKLPCEIGDTIYERFYGRTTSFSVIGFRKGVIMSECDDYEEIDCDEWYVEYACDGTACSSPISEIGETIFLTRAEAEAALSALEVE